MQVSIIIPLYKVEKYIKRCLRSVVDQTFTDYEVILVDDCSQDNSLKIAELFLTANNINFQSMRHTENKKQGAARNSGLKLAKGEYVLFIDADDEFADIGALQCLYAEMVSGDYDFVTAEAQHIVDGEERIKLRTNGAKRPADPVGWRRAGNEQMTVLPKAKKSSVNAVARQSEGRAFDSTPSCAAGFHTQYERREARHLNVVTVLNEGSIVQAFGNNKIAPVVWNKLIRKTFLLENNICFVEHTSFEDIPYCFILMFKAQKVALINQVTYRYYFADNAGATTASLDDEKVQNAVTMLEALLVYVDKNNVVASVGIYPVYQIVCRVMSYLLAHRSLLVDKTRWIRCYIDLQKLYNGSLLFDYRKRLTFSADFAYYLAFRPYVSNRSKIVNNLYSKVLLALRMYNIRGGAALVHKFLQRISD